MHLFVICNVYIYLMMKSDEGYFLEVDIPYTEKLGYLQNDLPYLPQRMKIEKVEKLIANLHKKLNALFI